MLPELRYVKELRKENERLNKVLQKKKLTNEQKSIIEQQISKNEKTIESITKELLPLIAKLNDTEQQTFIEAYYLNNKDNHEAEDLAHTHYALDSLKAICNRNLKAFWKWL